jgi:ATP-dependent DNA helicase RecQ
MTVSPQDVLKQYFGFPSFRGRQQEVIDHVLADRHALVIMPTGGGKSLCYQIPALVHDHNSDDQTKKNHRAVSTPLTMVISPLIALMKDQVDALRRRAISATFINSSLGRRDREKRYRDVAMGKYSLLYVTPERFRKPEFRDVIAQRTVRLLAVDEAHCISEWGHDFRPDYTRLREFRALLGDPTTIALTATATPDVQQDIVRQLGLENADMKMFHEGIDRPNLELNVNVVWGDDDKVEQIVKIQKRFEDSPGSGIVYFTLIKTLSRFSDFLHERRVWHSCYHGDLDRNSRRRVQNEFMSEDGSLVLATNAFGMGIDKEDIRFVAHAEVPGSMESWYQEIGRSGRDGLPAECTLLYDERDLATQMEFIRWSNPSADFYQRVYDLVVNESEKCEALGFEYLRERLHGRQKHDHRLETALSMLDRHGVIEGTTHPFRMRVLSDMPEMLLDQDRLDSKLLRDQQKLYALVQFIRHEGERKDFIHEYFGLTVR